MMAKVILWANRMVMVFDEYGRQIPEYQDEFAKVRDKILKDSTPKTEFSIGMWQEGIKTVSKDEWMEG